MVRTYTTDELTALGTPHKSLQAAMKINPGPPPFTLEESKDFNAMRSKRIAYLDTQRGDYPVPGPIPDLVTEQDVYINFNDIKIQVRVYSSAQPPKQQQHLPVVVLMHEGGFMLGDITDEEHNARLFVSSFDCIVLNIEYPLAPENAFPIGIKGCYHVIETLCTAPETFHVLADPSKGLVLGGSSAGGNLSAVLMHYSRQQKLAPPVTGTWLGVPFLFPTHMVPDRYKSLLHSNDMRVDPVLDQGEDEETFKALYQAIQIGEMDDPLFTPFASAYYPPNTTNNAATLMPLGKTFIQAGGLDALRDQAIIYAKALDEEWEAEVRLNVYGGYGHMFWTNWPQLEESKKFWKDTVEGFEWLLGQKKRRDW